jgi:hypothetical protein
MAYLHAFAMGFALTMGIEFALGLIMAISHVCKRRK